jgi:hypothetical protein
MKVRYEYDGPSEELARREVLARPIAAHHEEALGAFRRPAEGGWIVRLGSTLLFDAAGLALVDRALRAYRGAAAQLDFEIAMDDAVYRDYYSLGPPGSRADRPALPITAVRSGADGPTETLTLVLTSSLERLPLPAGLAEPVQVGLPHALLLPYHGPFDLLFANQIALGSALRRRVARSPRTWLRSRLGHYGVHSSAQRAARAYRRVHRTAEVHPTAVIEGSSIGAGARVGAHAVVRYSVVGEGARLHDGAKVEMSVVGTGAWLMHDLVLYRSVAEEGTFLIHGPYQFSYFERGSGAFATIMMDYRPDARPIQVRTPAGLRPYGGPFLGAVLGEGSKTLGGCLLAPGRIVPARTWLSADPESIHALDESDLPTERPVPPRSSARMAR